MSYYIPPSIYNLTANETATGISTLAGLCQWTQSSFLCLITVIPIATLSLAFACVVAYYCMITPQKEVLYEMQPIHSSPLLPQCCHDYLRENRFTALSSVVLRSNGGGGGGGDSFVNMNASINVNKRHKQNNGTVTGASFVGSEDVNNNNNNNNNKFQFRSGDNFAGEHQHPHERPLDAEDQVLYKLLKPLLPVPLKSFLPTYLEYIIEPCAMLGVSSIGDILRLNPLALRDVGVGPREVQMLSRELERRVKHRMVALDREERIRREEASKREEKL